MSSLGLVTCKDTKTPALLHNFQYTARENERGSMPFKLGEFRDPNSREPFTCLEIIQDIMAALLFFAAVCVVGYILGLIFR